jgi:phenylacetate-CoA ligase
MLVVRGVNVFPSAVEGIVRRFAAVDEFQIEVFRERELDEIRLLLEMADGAGSGVVAGVREAIRVELGIRIDAVAVPAGSLPRYELKSRRLVRLSIPPGHP